MRKIGNVRIDGYKSFADPVDLPILPGVTAIVGPNGCGKSNLIEALRWGQGEASAKKLRAEAMDDVVFGGTDTRPARAAATVTVRLEAADGPTVDVSRTLTRGDGSAYRVDGRETRARDVKTLFQDAGAGAGSMAHVSQGAVGSLINAKPSERRGILEEAAGVAGLSTRRHEADLRLKGAEQNLERAEDLEKGLGDQMATLRRQARQAARARGIDALVRQAEATTFLSRSLDAAARRVSVETAHAANEELVAEAILAARAASAREAVLSESLAPLARALASAEAVAAVARAKLAGAEREAASVRSARAAAVRARARAEADAEREREASAVLDEELLDVLDRVSGAEDARSHDAEEIEYATARLAEEDEAVAALGAEVEELATALARADGLRASAVKSLSEAAGRVNSLDARVTAGRSDRDANARRLSALGAPDGSSDAALEVHDAAESALSAAEEHLLACEASVEPTRSASVSAAASLAALEAEAAALRAAATATPGLAADLSCAPGLEAALLAALSDGLDAVAGGAGPRRWAGSEVRVGTPSGTAPLAGTATVPAELDAALSGIGLLPDGADGDALARHLKAGQSLVSTDGRSWRWDGFRSSASGAAADAMRRAARLREVESLLPAASRADAEARAILGAATDALASARRAAVEGRDALRRARSELDAVRRRAEGAEAERLALSSRVAALTASLETLLEDRAAAAIDLAERESEARALPDAQADASSLSEARASLAAAVADQASARTALEGVRREAAGRHAEIARLRATEADLRRRLAEGSERVRELGSRAEEAAASEAEAAAAEEYLPETEAAARLELEEADAARMTAAAAAAEGDRSLSGAATARRDAEEAQSGLRETRARLLAEMRAAMESEEAVARECAERLSCGPDRLRAESGIPEGDEVPPAEACEARLAKLRRERDGIGAVNPLAEEQVAEMETRLGDAQRSREELREAVRRLRQSMAEFDREARQRVSDAFAAVDGHFRTLFERLFRGGHAHLRLSGSDDPLVAGLEIYACPPGKRLQTLSLMSGGEQALAALALVFAAFLVRPAPVCILDEVDAPLDDANVDRLCALVHDMARDDATRFLVVTHHALTMARADRLVGVTMAERGVSTVVSLGLDAALGHAEVGEPG